MKRLCVLFYVRNTPETLQHRRWRVIVFVQHLDFVYH